MTGTPHRTSSAAGFTLIEMLVTITLLSLLVLLLFGGLRFGARAWDGAQAHSVRTDELRVVQGLLRREIEQAYPYYDTSDPVHPVVDFQGSSNRLTFLALAPQASESSGRSRITIYGAGEGGQLQLTMRAEPELATSRDNGWSAPLLRNVAAVRMSYFAGDHWSNDWTQKKAMPSLVRVQVEFRPGDGRVWPDLIVAPRIDADAGCLYDIATKRCAGRP